MLVRVIAVALIGWAAAELVLYLAVGEHNHAPMKFFPCLLRALPLLAGLIMLVAAKPIAEWISNKLDD